MKNLSIILACILVAMMSCTKSKEVHPELGDGNEEFLTVGTKTAHVEYTRADMAELRKVVFHFGLSGSQQFAMAEMTKKVDFFDLTLNDLVSDTLYQYYYELFPSNGEASITEQKTFHTIAVDSPVPPTPPVAELPTVVTEEVSDITANSAVCDGEVTTDGGAEVTERGICWSANENPTVNDNYDAVGEGIGTFSATINGLEANTAYHVRAYATNEAGTAYGQDVEFTTLEGGGSGEHEWIDLGLPSGTLWATCNVGANAPEEFGDYFAWGETQTKNIYNWNTYQHCCNGNGRQLIKYCTKSSYGNNGFVDNLTEVQPNDDAATVNWDSEWCMPTGEQWEELLNNTNCTWTTLNGVNGRQFSGSNGQIIFLPAAGYWGNNFSTDSIGSQGMYWSSSLNSDEPDLGAHLFFTFDNCLLHFFSYRYFGNPIRPVRSTSKK